MNSSLNELQSLLRRCFEALFAHRLDFEQCAQDIAWLQAHKFQGVQAMCQSIDRLDELRARPALNTLTWTDEQTVDIRESSLLIAAPYLIDVTIAAAKENGEFTLTISAADKPVALLAGFQRIAEHRLSAQLSWQDAGSCEMHEAVLPLGSRLPTYRRLRTEQPITNSSLVLQVTRKAVRGHAKTYNRESIIESLSEQDMQNSFSQSIRDGIDVPERCYKKLSAVADRLLVEASEQSRRGAGA